MCRARLHDRYVMHKPARRKVSRRSGLAGLTSIDEPNAHPAEPLEQLALRGGHLGVVTLTRLMIIAKQMENTVDHQDLHTSCGGGSWGAAQSSIECIGPRGLHVGIGHTCACGVEVSPSWSAVDAPAARRATCEIARPPDDPQCRAR